MFSNISAGWVDFEFSNQFKTSISYLTHVPILVMDKLIEHFKDNLPTAMYFDCEGTDFILVVDNYVSYVISNAEEKPELYYNEDLTAEVFTKNFYKDLIDNFDKFIMFDLNYNGDKTSYNSCKNKLVAKFSEFCSVIIEKGIITTDEYVNDVLTTIRNLEFHE